MGLFETRDTNLSKWDLTTENSDEKDINHERHERHEKRRMKKI